MRPFHLHLNSTVSRYQTTTREYALSEPDMPKGSGLPQDLVDIVKYLDASNSPRYGKNNMFSHVYAYDYCYLAGAYLPNIWWGNVSNPDAPKVRMNAATLYDWFIEFGEDFGWKSIQDFKEAQNLADVGHVVAIVGHPKQTTHKGLISMVIPKHPSFKDKGLTGAATPLQSRGGKTYIKTEWYKGHKYKGYKIYVNFLT